MATKAWRFLRLLDSSNTQKSEYLDNETFFFFKKNINGWYLKDYNMVKNSFLADAIFKKCKKCKNVRRLWNLSNIKTLHRKHLMTGSQWNDCSEQFPGSSYLVRFQALIQVFYKKWLGHGCFLRKLSERHCSFWTLLFLL